MERSWRERLTRWRRSVVVAGALSVVIALTLTTAGAGMADDDRKAGKPTQKIAATHGIASGTDDAGLDGYVPGGIWAVTAAERKSGRIPPKVVRTYL